MSYPEVGSVVEYVDEYARSQDALVTTVHDGGTRRTDGILPAINVVVVSFDESQTDQYGRQIARPCSVSAEGPSTAHGRFYRVK